MAELVVRVAIRGNLATYKWEGQLPFERDVTPHCKPPNPHRASEPTWLLVKGLKKIGLVADFQLDSGELLLRCTTPAKWDALNKAVQELLVATVPKVKRVKLVSATPIFEVKELGLQRTYTPPSASQFVNLGKLEGVLKVIYGIRVGEVHEKRVVVELSEHIHWREPHVDIVLALDRFCN